MPAATLLKQSIRQYVLLLRPSVLADRWQIPIDHWNSSVGTYQNRYWVDDERYQPGGPIFVYDAGETDASVYVSSQLQKKKSFLQEFLKRFNGMGIIWEHRYVGLPTKVFF